jgi:hypothetical protein
MTAPLLQAPARGRTLVASQLFSANLNIVEFAGEERTWGSHTEKITELVIQFPEYHISMVQYQNPF